ncbi:hypothetical protein [Nonomuraea sp. B1E8]|uniref:hypothetical protein n=1 Tax=unclassified Nonomuraea TaxID=2593643 RepID=UPI00325F4135
MSVALGLLAILPLTLATGYFVAQEFAYVVLLVRVDRSCSPGATAALPLRF